MKPRRLTKLVLKKDVVSKLENEQMNQMRGGMNPGPSMLESIGRGGWDNPFNCLGVNCGGGGEKRKKQEDATATDTSTTYCYTDSQCYQCA